MALAQWSVAHDVYIIREEFLTITRSFRMSTRLRIRSTMRRSTRVLRPSPALMASMLSRSKESET